MDVFETLGTLIGVCTKAGMVDEEGKIERVRPAMLADAIATSTGAIFGTSTITSYVESSAGVAEGGRTGLTSVVTAFLFLLSVFFCAVIYYHTFVCDISGASLCRIHDVFFYHKTEIIGGKFS